MAAQHTIRPDGFEEWLENGVHHRLDGPAVIHPHGGEEWYQYGALHRSNGPAITYKNGYEEWRINGLLHRRGGPAIVSLTGNQWWFIGICVNNYYNYQWMSGCSDADLVVFKLKWGSIDGWV